MEQKITREMTIDEIFKQFPHKSPKLAQEMTNTGLHCVGCSASTWETLEAGMFSHGKNEAEIEDLLNRLNKVLEEKEDPTTITITERAAKKYNEILEEEGKLAGASVLASARQAAAVSNISLTIQRKRNRAISILNHSGIQIHLHHKSVDRLMGCVIDYVDGLQGSGFKITNPNVKASCGCGNSHGY